MEDQINNYDLCCYYHDNVEIRNTARQASIDTVMPKVTSILQYVHEQDPRFSDEPLEQGSYWQGLKVDRPDEFDLAVPLCEVDELQWCASKLRYYDFNRDTKDKLTTIPEDLEVVYMDVPLPEPSEGFYCITLESPESDIWANSDDMFFDDDLIPFLVRKRFKKLLIEAVRKLKLRSK